MIEDPYQTMPLDMLTPSGIIHRHRPVNTAAPYHGVTLASNLKSAALF